MSMERLRHRAESMLPGVVLLCIGSVAIGSVVDFTGGSSSPNSAEAKVDKLPAGQFDPNRPGLKQWGSVDCDSSDPDYHERSVSVGRTNPISGVLRVMYGAELVEAVKIRINGASGTLGIAGWRPIPGLVANLNEAYLGVPEGVSYDLGGDSLLTVTGDDEQTTLKVECVSPKPKTQPDS